MLDFTIIIPTYNDLNLFVKAYSSVKEQKDVEFQIIVVDDSVILDIEDYISQQNDDRILYIHNKPSLGAVRNWNFGLENVVGKYVVLLHHDECFNDKYLYLKKCLTVFNKKKCDVIVSDIVVNFINNNISRKLFFPDLFKSFILNSIPSFLYIMNIVGPVSCIIFRRDSITYFDERLCWLVDIEWYYNMFVGKRIIFDNNLIVNSTHGHEGQITNNINVDQRRKNDLNILLLKYKFKPSILISIYIGNLIYYLKNSFFLKRITFWKSSL